MTPRQAEFPVVSNTDRLREPREPLRQSRAGSRFDRSRDDIGGGKVAKHVQEDSIVPAGRNGYSREIHVGDFDERGPNARSTGDDRQDIERHRRESRFNGPDRYSDRKMRTSVDTSMDVDLHPPSRAYMPTTGSNAVRLAEVDRRQGDRLPTGPRTLHSGGTSTTPVIASSQLPTQQEYRETDRMNTSRGIVYQYPVKIYF